MSCKIADVSNMPYYQILQVSAAERHMTKIANKSNLPYFTAGLGEAATVSGRPIVAQTTVAYATIFEAMPGVGWGRAGWQAAKNLSGFQKSGTCMSALPLARDYLQLRGYGQLLSDQYFLPACKNLRISASCVKSATFCIISAMRGQS